MLDLSGVRVDDRLGRLLDLSGFRVDDRLGSGILVATIQNFEIFPPQTLTFSVPFGRPQSRCSRRLRGQIPATRMKVIEPLSHGVGCGGLQREAHDRVR